MEHDWPQPLSPFLNSRSGAVPAFPGSIPPHTCVSTHFALGWYSWASQYRHAVRYFISDHFSVQPVPTRSLRNIASIDVDELSGCSTTAAWRQRRRRSRSLDRQSGCIGFDPFPLVWSPTLAFMPSLNDCELLGTYRSWIASYWFFHVGGMRILSRV